ncbi:MAG: hypothetical protein COA44_06650 [Arcobacter sp.]|nr:MAG: hypothetical protein COA44_06650 [Arcobacter sp.]
MYFRVFSLSLSLFLLSACVDNSEPSEFDTMRMQMQKRQNSNFGNSVKNLEHRKDKLYKRTNRSSFQLDPYEKERIAEQKAEDKRWTDLGINLVEAQDWKALGLSPKRASHWKKTGLSYNTIGVLIKEDVLPSEAVSFMNKKFNKHPKAFSDFAEPLYNFQESCQKVIKLDAPELAKVNRKCHEYVEQLNYSSVSGYMADEYQDNDLSLEYISKLRQVDNQKAYILKEMVISSQKCLINNHKESFAVLFPILEVSPTKEEMFFIKKNHLALNGTQRYKSYEYYDFWINKEENEEKARKAVIKQQQALNRAKDKRLKKEAYRMNALAYNKMVASECGESVSSAPSTGEKVHIEGEILHKIGKKGSNIFAYIIRNNKDKKNYLVRDPNAQREKEVNTEISWIAITVGRVVSVSLDDDGTASYNHYSEDDKEFYPMLKRVSKCQYHTKKLVR